MRSGSLLGLLAFASFSLGAEVKLDQYDPACGIKICKLDDDNLGVSWPVSAQEFGWATLDLKPGQLLGGVGLVKDAASRPIFGFEG